MTAQDDIAATATATANAPAPDVKELPGKKKRGADHQITKDDGERGDDEGTEAPTGEFQKADADTLSKRRIVKIKRPTGGESISSTGEAVAGDGTKKSNPFAMALSGTSGSNVFGSGFGGTKQEGTGGFGSSSTAGFGFGSSSGFSGFGSAKPAGNAAGFGSTSASTSKSLFGSGEKEETQKFGFLSATTSTTESAATEKEVFPQDVSVVNGEEGDECVYEVRCKSYLLVEEEEKKAEKEGTEEANRPSMSVPPSSLTAPKKADDDKAEADEKAKEGETKEEEKKVADKPVESKVEESKEGGEKKQQRWREMGKGPLRVLKKDGTSRIVQRREASAGGMGYQLLVNAILAKESKLTQPSDEKFVQLGTFADPPVSYLFKVRTAQDATELKESLQKEIDAAKSVVKE